MLTPTRFSLLMVLAALAGPSSLASTSSVVDTSSRFAFDFAVTSSMEEVVEEEVVPAVFPHQAGVQLRRVTPDGSDAVFQVNLAYGGSGGPPSYEQEIYLLDDAWEDFPDFSGTYVSALTGRRIGYSITGLRDSGGGWEGTTSGRVDLRVLPDSGPGWWVTGLAMALLGLWSRHPRRAAGSVS